MGALDEAIREHLALKRRLGAPEEELKTKEDEAFGHGRSLPSPSPPTETATELEDAAPGLEPQPEILVDDLSGDTAEHEPEPEPIKPESAVTAPEPGVLEEPPPMEDFEPDEVLPEESLEPEHEPGSAPSSEDVLEETPEFLDQSPDQDRLWFEQKPPKDFDFDD